MTNVMNLTDAPIINQKEPITKELREAARQEDLHDLNQFIRAVASNAVHIVMARTQRVAYCGADEDVKDGIVRLLHRVAADDMIQIVEADEANPAPEGKKKDSDKAVVEAMEAIIAKTEKKK